MVTLAVRLVDFALFSAFRSNVQTGVEVLVPSGSVLATGCFRLTNADPVPGKRRDQYTQCSFEEGLLDWSDRTGGY